MILLQDGYEDSAAFAKLNKALSAIAEAMIQLQLDVAKLGARAAAIDSEIASLGRRLGREGNASGEPENRRDLELERAVFGRMGTSRREVEGSRTRHGRTNESNRDVAKKERIPAAKRKR